MAAGGGIPLRARAPRVPPGVELTSAPHKSLNKRKKTNRIDAEVLTKRAIWNVDALHKVQARMR